MSSVFFNKLLRLTYFLYSAPDASPVTLLPQEADQLLQLLVNPDIYRQTSASQGQEPGIGMLMQNIFQVSILDLEYTYMCALFVALARIMVGLSPHTCLTTKWWILPRSLVQ